MELVFTGLAVLIIAALVIAAAKLIVAGGVLFALGCMFAPLFKVASPLGFAPALVLFFALSWVLVWMNSNVTHYSVRRY